MRRSTILSAAVLVCLFITPQAAHAYIGPGAGITAIGAVLGLVSALGLAIAGLVWYPIRRLRAKRRDRRTRALTRSENSV
jgi:hypothetical protein